MAHRLRLWYSSTRDLTGDIIAQGDTQDRARDSLAVILQGRTSVHPSAVSGAKITTDAALLQTSQAQAGFRQEEIAHT